MPKRMPAFAIVVAVVAAIVLLHHPQPVHAQSGQLQIASISVSADQTLTYPDGPPASPYLLNLPDEHTTIIPPATSSAPYLIFGASGISTAWAGTVALQSTDLQNFTFATALGYSPQVMASPLGFGSCNATYASEFDETYAAQTFIDQDPTLPAGNMVMLYEAENHCGDTTGGPGGTAYVGFTRSSDNGMTWPAPETGPTGGPNRYPVIESNGPPATDTQITTGVFIGNQAESGFIDKSLDGNYYLYATFATPPNYGSGIHVARAALGQSHPTFMKWYNGSFSQPGLGGLDAGLPLTCASLTNSFGNMGTINYVDDLGLYLLTFECGNSAVGAWFYSTATSLDIQDWTPPQMIANSEYPVTICPTVGTPEFDGNYPSLMSPGTAVGHIKLSGTVFYLKGCVDGVNSATTPRLFTSRTFTINTQPQPAPVLTSGSVANGATYLSGGLVAGSWAQVQGTGLSNATRIWTGFDFLNLGTGLPTKLSGVQVTVNGIPAPVYYISPTQIDFQVPSGVSGNASVQVIVNGSASNTLTAPASASSPGLFPNTVNGVNYPASVYASGIFVGPSGVSGYLPASVYYHVSLFATGLTAEPAGVIPTAAQISGVTVTVGNTVIPADYAGQTPYVGEFQINFTLPESMSTLPAGNYPISITYNGVSSPTMIGNPPAPIVLPFVPPN